MRSALDLVSLGDFRSYERAELQLGGQSAFLFGPNGAGKTNLLEAISLFSPGRGLRGASFADLGRRSLAEAPGASWSIFGRAVVGDLEAAIGSGSDGAQPGRRVVRIDGEPAAPSAMARWVRPIWLTPAQDRLFLETAAERRRFFDRLVFAGDPDHAKAVGSYDRALRERSRLLAEGGADEAWLTALEARMAAAGALAVRGRVSTLAALRREIDERGGGVFPRAALELTGAWEGLAAEGATAEEIEARLGAALAAGRGRDAAAGRTLEGPHRGDLKVARAESGTLAADCSTGEQKALILNLVLAQAARLSRAQSQPNPILLLDEVAAHLDPLRRAALFDEIDALSLQAILTGTEEALFASLKGRWIGVEVAASQLAPMEG